MQSISNPGAVIIEGHVQGLSNLRILAKAGIPGIVVDRGDCIARHSKYCRGFFKCPAYDDDALADFLLELGERERLHGWLLLPSNDHGVATLVRNWERLQTVFKWMAPPPTTFESIYDKAKLLNLAQKCDIPIPRTAFLAEVDSGTNGLTFPVITKGRRGLSFYKTVGKKAILSNNETELRRTMRRLQSRLDLSETFTQEVIPSDGTNKTVSFAAFCVNGEIRAFWMGAKLREHPLQFGTATFCESVYEQACLDQSAPLLRALDYNGVCEIEYLRDPRDGRFKLIEINARTWLWVGLATACGVNFPLYVYNHVNGLPSVYPAGYPLGVRWRNFWTDTVFSLQAVITGRLGLKAYLESLRGDGLIDAVRDKDDPKPFWAMSMMLLKLASR